MAARRKKDRIWSATASAHKVRISLKLSRSDGRTITGYAELDPNDAIAFGQKLQDEASIAKDPS